MLNGLDLFSGIGGLAIALSGYVRPIAYCEIDRYAQAVLLSRMSEGKIALAPIWNNVRTLSYDSFDRRIPIDCIYGGFPCQDLSTAGLQKGLEAERSGLFFEIMRLAEEIKPEFIFLENVPGIRNYLGLVAKEMAALRYDCRWGMLSAYDVGAPHKRERWFCLARSRNGQNRNIHSNSENFRGQKIKKGTGHTQVEPVPRTIRSMVSNADSSGLPQSNGKRCAGETQFTESPRSNPWAIEPDVGRVVNGLQFRRDRIKCLGNAVVPQQAREAFERLMGIT